VMRVIARRPAGATKQSRSEAFDPGLLRFARNDIFPKKYPAQGRAQQTNLNPSSGGAKVGHASLMRPGRPLPTKSSACKPLRQSPNVCLGGERGLLRRWRHTYLRCSFWTNQVSACVTNLSSVIADTIRRTSAANPKFARNCRHSDCELRVQSGTRIIELLVSFDSEVRFGTGGKLGRTSESGH